MSAAGAGAGGSQRELSEDQLAETLHQIAIQAKSVETQVRNAIASETPDAQALQLNQLLNWLNNSIKLSSDTNTTLVFTFLAALIKKDLAIDVTAGSDLPDTLAPYLKPFLEPLSVQEFEPSSPTSVLLATLMTTPDQTPTTTFPGETPFDFH